MEIEPQVVRRRLVCDGVVELTLALPGGSPLPQWQPGAHIDLHLGQHVRQYSLTGLESTATEWIVSVLREPASRGGSDYAHDSVAEGSMIRVSLPRNNFTFTRTGREPVVLVAGGIGITPLLPMIAALEGQGRDWSLFYAGRSRSAMAYVDELMKFGDRVSIRPDDEYGVPDLRTLVSATPAAAVIYSCGPEGMLGALETICDDPASRRTLRVERFTPRVFDTDGPDVGFQVEFVQSRLTATVPANRSILEVAEELGVDILSSCAEGTCGTCETPVLAGVPDHRDSVLSKDEREAGDTMMPCVSRSCSALLKLDV